MGHFFCFFFFFGCRSFSRSTLAISCFFHFPVLRFPFPRFQQPNLSNAKFTEAYAITFLNQPYVKQIGERVSKKNMSYIFS